MKLIQKNLYNQNQSWNYLEIIEDTHGNRLRISVRRNAYEEQSHAKVERWDGNQWQFVTSIPITECACYDISYVTKDPDQTLFEQDAVMLRLYAEAICKP